MKYLRLAAILFACAYLLPGCFGPDPALLNALGLGVCLALAILLGLTYLVPWIGPMIKEVPIPRALKKWTRWAAIFLTWGTQVVGASMACLLIGSDSTRFLLALVGLILVVAGYFFRMWIYSNDSEALKRASLCITTLIAMVWLFFKGAEMLRL